MKKRGHWTIRVSLKMRDDVTYEVTQEIAYDIGRWNVPMHKYMKKLNAAIRCIALYLDLPVTEIVSMGED
jgi:hypothetical protein